MTRRLSDQLLAVPSPPCPQAAEPRPRGLQFCASYKLWCCSGWPREDLDLALLLSATLAGIDMLSDIHSSGMSAQRPR